VDSYIKQLICGN